MVHYRSGHGNARESKTACGKTVHTDLTSPWAYRVTCAKCKAAITRAGLGAGRK